MRSAESTGDECPGGSAVRQMTFLAGPNSVGRPIVSETPEALGPRNWGQSAASTRHATPATSTITGRRGIQTVYRRWKDRVRGKRSKRVTIAAPRSQTDAGRRATIVKLKSKLY